MIAGLPAEKNTLFCIGDCCAKIIWVFYNAKVVIIAIHCAKQNCTCAASCYINTPVGSQLHGSELFIGVDNKLGIGNIDRIEVILKNLIAGGINIVPDRDK